jgi:hypothetical protein
VSKPKIQRFTVFPPDTPHTDEARAAVPKEDMGEIYLFHCPGCGYGHSYRTKAAKGETRGPNRERVPTWVFNGSMEAPTFTPSLLVHGWKDDNGKSVGRCHLFLTSGVIQFCGDCDHALAGKSVPLEPID